MPSFRVQKRRGCAGVSACMCMRRSKSWKMPSGRLVIVRSEIGAEASEVSASRRIALRPATRLQQVCFLSEARARPFRPKRVLRQWVTRKRRVRLFDRVTAITAKCCKRCAKCLLLKANLSRVESPSLQAGTTGATSKAARRARETVKTVSECFIAMMNKEVAAQIGTEMVVRLGFAPALRGLCACPINGLRGRAALASWAC